ncbi:phage major capsid protein [Lysobacter enzymogenes]|uniref:phage major capsid protein n=1 Tax=Lysobacter enzymogenes TaxID=69 RepID=UPI00089BA812|nr:phage major capsid protein [Lysobacter enzymogenes]SDW94763.1 phage major capsid protein, HK97 family [Lysobacter enzymogenes]
MSEEIKKAVEDGIKSLETKMAAQALEYEKQIKDVGEVNAQLKADLEKNVEERKAMADRLTELEQKGVRAPAQDAPTSLGQQFANSAQFKAMAGDNENARCKVSVKNTLLSDATNVLPMQRPDIVGGPAVPLTVYGSLPHAPISSNSLEGIRETGFTNNAAEVAEGATKPESSLTFGPYDFPVRTIAHWIKVSKNLLSDSAAVAAYIDNRLRYGVLERADKQIVIGNGTAPNLSGILDGGNYTVYTPTPGDNLVDAIGRAKWQLWAAGWIPDKVYVNPIDWGAMELAKDADGRYLYGVPGLNVARNPFDVQVVPSPWVPAGQFAIGAFNRAVTIWDRESVDVEAGYVNDDFIKNLVTLRAEMRMALEITMPSAILGGVFTSS